jgi:hypothetical protein
MTRMPQFSDRQRNAQLLVVEAIGRSTFDEARSQLQELVREREWLSPPVLSVGAALVQVLTDDGARLFEFDERLWEELLPDSRPRGKSEWRNANYAVHAAGCLAAGMWLDVGRHESFWRLPLWPFALDVVELLVEVVKSRCRLDAQDVLAAVRSRLG